MGSSKLGVVVRAKRLYVCPPIERSAYFQGTGEKVDAGSMTGTTVVKAWGVEGLNARVVDGMVLDMVLEWMLERAGETWTFLKSVVLEFADALILTSLLGQPAVSAAQQTQVFGYIMHEEASQRWRGERSLDILVYSIVA